MFIAFINTTSALLQSLLDSTTSANTRTALLKLKLMPDLNAMIHKSSWTIELYLNQIIPETIPKSFKTVFYFYGEGGVQ